MDKQQLQNKIEELSKKVEELITKQESLKNESQILSEKFREHRHSGNDGSEILDNELNLKSETPIKMGLGGIIAFSNSNSTPPGSVGEQITLGIASGKDMEGGVGTVGGNLQLNLIHQPQNTSNQSFITAFRPPLYGTVSGSTISVTAAGNTVTINGYNFTTNILAGALINIYNSSGSLVETQTIASNTSTVITISGTWVSSTSGGTFIIHQPVYLGSADTVWQRFYAQEGTAGGIRIGVGTTNGGQNGLLYMDSSGDLYWRNKAGTSTKLN